MLFACFKRQGSFSSRDITTHEASSAGAFAASDLKRRLQNWLGGDGGTASSKGDEVPTADDLRLMSDPDDRALVLGEQIADADAAQLAASITALRRHRVPAGDSAELDEIKVSQLAGFVGE